MLLVLRNNLVWLVVFTLVTVTVGLLIAVLTDRVRYEKAVKALIFLPMAISFVAAGVIWSSCTSSSPRATAQVGHRQRHPERPLAGLPAPGLAVQQVPEQLGAHHRRDLDVGGVRDGDPLRGPQGHLGVPPRGGADRRRAGGPDFLPHHPARSCGPRSRWSPPRWSSPC